MKRIIIHWTAGTNQPNNVDKEHYHYLIDGDGKIHQGKYKPEDNENCSDGRYAAHTGGGNTGSIGISMCGMFIPAKSDLRQTKFPLTRKQCEACFKLCADVAKKYGIPITAQNIMTHYEFGKSHPNTSSAGKIDIIYLPPYPEQTADKIGDFIRNKIRWYSINT
jgi:N-acetyl-anhydromuramyl-L-alanine amidase AmpD